MSEKIKAPDALVRTLLKGLRDFGYDGLTYEEVASAAEDALNGVEREDVIGMFVDRLIEDARDAK